MDLYGILRTLHEERQRLDRIIERIQQLEEPDPTGRKRRGRRPATPGKRKRSAPAKRSRAPRR